MHSCDIISLRFIIANWDTLIPFLFVSFLCLKSKNLLFNFYFFVLRCRAPSGYKTCSTLGRALSALTSPSWNVQLQWMGHVQASKICNIWCRMSLLCWSELKILAIWFYKKMLLELSLTSNQWISSHIIPPNKHSYILKFQDKIYLDNCFICQQTFK